MIASQVLQFRCGLGLGVPLPRPYLLGQCDLRYLADSLLKLEVGVVIL